MIENKQNDRIGTFMNSRSDAEKQLEVIDLNVLEDKCVVLNTIQREEKL